MKRTGKQGRDQQGMAAILITMVTMMVISLIVLGFAQVARREQGQSLDRQLSTQAFYAAETGIEDARKVIDKAVEGGGTIPAKTDCTTSPAVTDAAGAPLPRYPEPTTGATLGNGVSYSCLLVDPTPSSLQYNGVELGSSTVVPMRSADGTNIGRVDIEWTPSDTDALNVSPAPTPTGDNCLSAATNVNDDNSRFFTSSWSCKYGMIRVDAVATGNNGAGQVNFQGLGVRNLSRDTMLNGQVSGWFVPTRVSPVTDANISYGAKSADNFSRAAAGQNPQPTIRRASCEVAKYGVCRASLTDMGLNNNYTLRISSQYKASNITIKAYPTNTSTSPLKLIGAQAVVDSTGKAQDVLRRIVARVPVNASRGQVLGNAIQSNGSICKRFEATPGYLYIPGYHPTGRVDNSNPMCLESSIPVGQRGTPSATP